MCGVVAVVVNEFGGASLLHLKTEKETSHRPHLRLHDHPGKWGATSEFRAGLTKQVSVFLSLNRLWLLRRPSVSKTESLSSAKKQTQNLGAHYTASHVPAEAWWLATSPLGPQETQEAQPACPRIQIGKQLL